MPRIMKKITKKQSELFVTQAAEMMLTMGAVNEDSKAKSNFVCFTINTVVGKLNVKIDRENIYCYTIFTKFVDVQKAKFFIGCNPFSGKYNLHTGDGDTPLNVLKTRIRDHFECVLSIGKAV